MSVEVANRTPVLHLDWFEWTALIASITWLQFAKLPVEREESMNMPNEKEATYYSEFRTTLCQTNHSLASQQWPRLQDSALRDKISKDSTVRSGCHGWPWRSSNDCAIVHTALNFWPMRHVLKASRTDFHAAAPLVHNNWVCPRRISKIILRLLLVTRHVSMPSCNDTDYIRKMIVWKIFSLYIV